MFKTNLALESKKIMSKDVNSKEAKRLMEPVTDLPPEDSSQMFEVESNFRSVKPIPNMPMNDIDLRVELNKTKTLLKTTDNLSNSIQLDNNILEDEAVTSMESKFIMSMNLPICPYCNLPVLKKYQDECHYPISKKNGGIATVPGHHLCNLLAESNIPRSNWPIIIEARKRYYKYKVVDKTITKITNLEKSLIRLNALDEDEFKDVWNPLKKKESQLRKEITKMVKELSKTDSVVSWLLEQKGVGSITVAGIIATLYPLDRFSKVSSVWHYTGHFPLAKKKGVKLTYSPNAKIVLNELAHSSLMGKGSYIREKYLPIRESMETKHPDYTKGHLLAASLFRAKKEFLKDLWIQSRLIEATPSVNSVLPMPMRLDEN